MTNIRREIIILEDLRGKRLDAVLAELFSEYSRSQLQVWLKQGKIRVDNMIGVLPKYKVKGGEYVVVEAERPMLESGEPEHIPLTIVYEDEAVLVLNKPAGLVVHPGAGQASGTLLNALLYHAACLKQVPRAGIIHRLDKDTSGLMVIAKTIESQFHLVKQLKERTVQRIYHVCVWGVVRTGFTASEPIGRHSRQRLKMAVQSIGQGKEAHTHFRVLKRWTAATYLEAKLETGRTHQIRVHLQHHGYPVIGDAVYGLQSKNMSVKQWIHRQALHAKALSFIHPVSGKACHFETELPEDINLLLANLH